MGSAVANVVQLVSLMIIGYNLITPRSTDTTAEPLAIGNKIPQFVSTTVFTYEGITVVSRFVSMVVVLVQRYYSLINRPCPFTDP